MGEYYTDDQRKDAIEENPDAIEGVMAAVYANFYAFERISTISSPTSDIPRQCYRSTTAARTCR